MKKKLEYIPIYRGKFNMTPEEYERRREAINYIRRCRYRNKIMIQTLIESIIFALAAGSLTYLMFWR